MASWKVFLLLTCLTWKIKSQPLTTRLYKGLMVTEEWWDLASFGELTFITGKLTMCAGLCIRNPECKFFSVQDGSTCQLGKSDSYAADTPIGTERIVYAVVKMCEGGSGVTCPSTPTVVDGTYHKVLYEVAVKAGVLFVDECEIGWENPNFWNAPAGMIGEDNSYLVFDLGCCMLASKAVIKNSHNYMAYHRQTKLFRLMFATDATYVKPDMTWTTVVSGELPTITETTACDDIQLVTFEIHPQPVRYVKFVVDSYDEFGGGLKFISIE